MAIQTYTIELKMDADAEQHEAMTQVMKQLAQQFKAMSMLLSKRPPLCVARTTDSFYDTSEIDLTPTDE